MEDKGNWELVLAKAAQGIDFSVNQTLRRSWEIYRKQPFAFAGFTLVIFCTLLFALILGQLGQMLANIILLPCLLIGYATFTQVIQEGKEKENGKKFFDGFKMVLSLGLVGMAINLLMTAAFAPTIILLNQLGLEEALKTFQESQDTSDLTLELSLKHKIVIGLNLIFGLYFIVAFMWSSLLVFFKNLPFYKAIEGSRRLISSNWWKFFLLLVSLWTIYILAFFAISVLSSLLGPIFAILGGIGTVIGLLIVIPMVFISTFLVFQETFAELSE